MIVVGPRGRLLADSEGEGLESTSYASRPEVAAALRGDPTQGERHSDTLSEDLLFTAVPVVNAGRTEGAVRVTQSVDDVNSEVRKDTIALVGVAAIVLLLGLGLAWLLAGTLARPLRRLADTARRVAGGDLDARARVEGSSEQREVASAFNDMTARLARALRAQREFVANASHQLRTPLTGLRLRLESASLKAKDPDVERDLVAAERETERLATLLSELLTLARERERPEPEDVSLAEVARRTSAGRRPPRAPGATCCSRAARASQSSRRPRPTSRSCSTTWSKTRSTTRRAGARSRSNGGPTARTRWSPCSTRDRASTRASASRSSSASSGAPPAAAARPARAWGSRWWRRWRRAGAAPSTWSTAPRAAPAPRWCCRWPPVRHNQALTRTLTTLYPGAGSLDPMRLRTAAIGLALAIFGLGAAVGIGFAANSISGDTVGLSAAPLSAGDGLRRRPRARPGRTRRASGVRNGAPNCAGRSAGRRGGARPSSARRPRPRPRRRRLRRPRPSPATTTGAAVTARTTRAATTARAPTAPARTRARRAARTTAQGTAAETTTSSPDTVR